MQQLSSEDDNSLMWFRWVIPMVLLFSLGVYFWQGDPALFPTSPDRFAITLIVGGLLLRWIAVISLGKYFTVQLTIHKKHQLKTDGVYSYIRHPSYTGLLLYYLGLGLFFQNPVSLFLLVVGPLAVVLYRVHLEEQVLHRHFGPTWMAYTSKTWRLLPFVY